jgi:chitodextrinase/pimeloyl-ACP methyl ester carboxylesterase
MKRNLSLLTLTFMFVTAGVYAQPNIFNPNDSVYNYNKAAPPATPAANTMAKWVRTTTRITSWNTNKFKAYYWNGMAFRLRFPNGYNAADTTKKYPVILFMHGAGEIQGVYDNEDQLFWGAQTFQSKIDSGLFNAFLLFPQVSATAWDYTYYTRINSVVDSMQKYVHSDPDRLIAMGLSNGAYGAMSYAANFPQRVSSIIASSPALIQLLMGTINNVIHIPFWVASGGLDTSPGPDVINNYVDTLAARGGDTRYSFYPTLGHGTWTAMWAEPYLVPTWNNAHIANPIIFNKVSQFCSNAVTAKLGITQGFAEYQWQVNGATIPNSNTNDITGTQLGSYSARFRRIAGGPWSDWSTVPAVITALPPTVSPSIIVTGNKSKVLPAPDGSTTTPLELPAGYTSYEWRKASDSSLVSTARTFAAPVGQYIAKATNCNSTFTPVFTIISATGTPRPDSARNLTLSRISPTSIKLNWADVANPVVNETAFEIYRAPQAGGPYTFAGITGSDIKIFTDTAISNNYNFYYRVRAISATGAAGLSNEASLQPVKDSIAPTVPTNLKAIFTSRNYIDLEWTASTDSVGVTAYDIYVNGTKKYTSTVPHISADSLASNVAYTFTVVARDQAGNVSTISSAATATTRLNGLKYHYYEGNWSMLPDFSTLTAVSSGQTPNIDISIRPANVIQNYAFLWEGFINIRIPGSYTFETSSDDGSKFYYNTFYSPTANALVNNDGVHGAVSVTGTVNITDTGLHPIAISFFQQSSGQSMQVYWTGPGITRQLIPNSAFTETLVASSDTIAPTVPANFKSTFTSRNYVDLTWDYSTDNIGVVGYDVYINNVKKYTTLTNSITADSLLPNIAYTFTVKARDFAGNNSAASTLTITTAATALKYKYYEGSWSVLPDFSTLTPVKTGSSPNIDISVRPAGIIQNYGFVWEGYINIRTPGNYTFETASDDGSKFYYNTFYSPSATALVNNDGVHGAILATGTVNITDTGMHPVAITFFQQSSGQSIQVYWTGPGIARQLIPDSAFTQGFRTPVDTIAPTAPTNLAAGFIGNTSVALTWKAATDNVGVVAYDIYVGGIKKYTSILNSITADSLAPNTTYSFTVKARDIAGNNSAASTPLLAKTTNSSAGVSYSFYQGSWSTLPDFSTLTPVKTGISANVDISVRPAGIDNNFAFVWQGYINIPAAGTYTLETVSDDGSKLYFNSQYTPTATALITNDGLHGPTSVTGTVNVSAPGYYPIAITYFQKDGGQSMAVYWSSSTITRQLIPAAAFVYQLPTDTIPPAAPTAVTAALINSTFINLTWTASTDNVGVTAYDVYGNGTKKYTTSTNSVTADSLTLGTSYTFTVKARDFAGNTSVASAPLTVSTSASAAGLNYSYYQGTWDVLPNFNTLTAVKTGISPNVDITLKPASVLYYYGFVWQGYINIPAPGTYTFETISDDGSKLYFNSQYAPAATATVNNDGLHGANTVSAQVTVATAGYYPIAITYFQKDGGQSMQVNWSGPGIPKQAIPNAAFVYQLPADNIAPAVPTNVMAALTNSTFINLSWTASTDNVGVTGYDVFVNGTKRYTTATTGVTVDSLTAGTSYTFTVVARDFAGNVSAPSAAFTTSTTSTSSGLTYKYYEGNWDLLPNFSLLTPLKTGFTPNIDIVTTRNVNYYFGYVWEGSISLPTAGTYTFETISDDGSKLYFNQKYSPAATALVNNDGVHGPISATGTVTVAAGAYPIAITFFQKNSGVSMQVYWSGPGIPRQLIPDAAFTGAFVLPTDTVAPSVPANVKAILTTNTYVDIAWDASTDNIGVTGYDVYVNNVKKTTVTGTNYRLTGVTAGQSNTFTIKSVDLANNMSAFSTALAVVSAPKANGLKYRYYEGTWDSMPNFDLLTPVKTGSSATVDISVRPSTVNYYYGFVWEGYINITTPGTYTFETISDDGSKFYWNTLYNPAASPLVNNDGLHAAISVTGSVNITTAGLYPISVTYFQKDGGASMALYYSGPGISRQPVPGSALNLSPDNPNQLTNTTTNAAGISLGAINGISADYAVNATITRAYPNPFTENLTVQYSSATAAGNVSVGIYDMSGRLVQRRVFGNLSAGTNTLSVSLDKQMIPGMYLVKLDVDGKPLKMWKMIKEKK